MYVLGSITYVCCNQASQRKVGSAVQPSFGLTGLHKKGLVRLCQIKIKSKIVESFTDCLKILRKCTCKYLATNPNFKEEKHLDLISCSRNWFKTKQSFSKTAFLSGTSNFFGPSYFETALVVHIFLFKILCRKKQCRR